MHNPDRDEALQNLKASLPQTSWLPRKRRSELPLEKIETETERQLKEQVKKQMDTNITLAGQLHKKKKFSSCYAYKPLSSMVSGTLSLENYQQLTEKDLEQEELKSCGLTDEEIELKLSSEEWPLGPSMQTSKYGRDPLVKKAVLESIDKKITRKQADLSKGSSFKATKELSRHEMDLERALSTNQERKAYLEMLLSDRQSTSGDTAYDGNDLKEMLRKIESKISVQIQYEQNERESSSGSESESQLTPALLPEATGCTTCDQLRRMDRCFVGPLLKTEYDYYEKCDSCKVLQNKSSDQIMGEHGKCKKKRNRKNKKGRLRSLNKEKDVLEGNKVVSKDGKDSPICADIPQITEVRDDFEQDGRQNMSAVQNKTLIPSNTENDTIVFSSKNSGVVENSKCNELVPIEVIERYKLSEDEIKQIPKFSSYSPGAPSKVLYLKNLSKKVTEDDLSCLFDHFRQADTPIQYKLLSGKMRGQAFVTFSEIESASKALKLVNGYHFKGKPIVIQNGRRMD